MTLAHSTITILVAADSLWQAISDFGAADRYLTGVITCTVEGQGVGALRTLTNADGSTIVERLEAQDDVHQQLSYALLTDTPFRNCLTTIALRELDSSRTELEWSAIFEPDGIPANEAVEMLEGMLSANCLELKQFIER